MNAFSYISNKENSNSHQGLNEFVQPKLRVGRSDDKYEREADRVAETVMRMPDPPAKIQAVEEEEEEKIQMSPEMATPLHMKPAVPQIQAMCTRCRERDRQGKPLNCPDCEQKLQMSPAIQRKDDGPMHASSQLSKQLQTTKGQGAPLSGRTRQEMGQKMGADFSSVNIHTDAKSIAMNRELGAKAFTHGRDIYFNKGEYRPESSQGKHLLAHELTHVVQQENSGNSILKQENSNGADVPEQRYNFKALEFKARVPRDLNSKATSVIEVLDAQWFSSQPGLIAIQVLDILEKQDLNDTEVMDLLRILKTRRRLGEFLQLIQVEEFRNYLKGKNVPWDFVFTYYETGPLDSAQFFAGYVAGVGEDIYEMARLIYVLTGSLFSKELARERTELFAAIKQLFNHPVVTAQEGFKKLQKTFENYLYRLNFFDAGRILAQVVLAVTDVSGAVKSLPKAASKVTAGLIKVGRLSWKGIKKLGISTKLLSEFARKPKLQLVTPKKFTLTYSNQDILITNSNGDPVGLINRQKVLQIIRKEELAKKAESPRLLSHDYLQIEDILSPDGNYFYITELESFYLKYQKAKGSEAISRSNWAVRVTSGKPREILEQQLGPNYARKKKITIEEQNIIPKGKQPDLQVARNWLKIGGRQLTEMKAEAKIYQSLWKEAGKVSEQKLIDSILSGDKSLLKKKDTKWAKGALATFNSEVKNAPKRAAYQVAKYLFGLHRNRFWNKVRNNNDAKRLLESAGWSVGKGAPINKFTGERLTMEHVIQKIDDPSIVLEPGNLMFSPNSENSAFLESMRSKLPHLFK